LREGREWKRGRRRGKGEKREREEGGEESGRLPMSEVC